MTPENDERPAGNSPVFRRSHSLNNENQFSSEKVEYHQHIVKIEKFTKNINRDLKQAYQEFVVMVA